MNARFTMMSVASLVLGATAPGLSAAQGSWTDSISISGNARLRYEGIDEAGEEERNRGRFRARLGITADVNDKVTANLRLATGGDNPVSTNQSFDGGFSTKDIGIDLAYLDWRPNDSTRVLGGKMKNPLHRAGSHGLIWDSDLNPEGVAMQYHSGGFFGNAGLLFVEERSSADDSLLLALQGGFSFDLSADAELTAGIGYSDYSEAQGNEPFYDGGARGNTVDIDGNLVFDFNQFEVFVELDTTLNELPFSMFANIVQNTEASVGDTGYAFGVAAGKASEPGTWQASWAYQDIERDAVVATFTDSNFGGGGTDSTGHVLKGKYALMDGWRLAGALFVNDIDAGIDNKHDYTRVQVDLEFEF